MPSVQDELIRFVELGALRIAFRLEEHFPDVQALRKRHHDRPTSLADACIVRVAELFDDHHVLTLDSDFTVYRKHARKSLSLICPR